MEKVPGSPVLRAAPFICLLLLSLLYIVDFDMTPSHPWKKLRMNWDGSRIKDQAQEHLHFLFKRLVEGESRTQLEATGFACRSNNRTDVCVSSRQVRVDTSTMKVYAPFSQGIPQANRTIYPYARRNLNTTVTPVQIHEGNITLPPACHYTHNVPVVIFSSGGLSGNIFHEFNEVIIPLFLTTHHFQSRVRFIVEDFRPGFVAKFGNFLSRLSSYEVINPAANGSIHCFPGAVVGLHYHGNLAINTTDVPEGYSMLDFKQFVRESYSLKIQDLSQMENPVLVLISREKTRKFIDEDEMVTMMKTLGFSVVVAKRDTMADLDKVAELLNSCSVLVGAHGAGLTNEIFLPEGAVMLQVVGLGLSWASNNFYGWPGTGMGLNYVEYRIKDEESSLYTLYGKDHPVVADRQTIYVQGYEVVREYYLNQQSFNINVTRFRTTLVKALGLLGRSPPSG